MTTPDGAGERPAEGPSAGDDGGPHASRARAAARSLGARLLAPPRAHVGDLISVGNSIGFMRFALAALVIVHHTRVLGGYGDDPVLAFARGQADLGVFAVAGFFALSGFLITRSALHVSVPRYLWHRSLRILPAFWICLAVVALVFGPLLWFGHHGELGGYLQSHASPLGYMVRNVALVIRQGNIDAIVEGNPYPRGINGSLWTLAIEFAWYLIVALLALFRLLRHRWVVAALVLYVAVTSFAHVQPLAGIPVIGYGLTARFALAFSAGMFAYLYRDRVPLDDRLAAVAAVLMLGTLRFGGFSVVGMAALSYLVLWAAWRIPLRGFGTRHDLSYGLYIYAFPVQQSIAFFGHGLPFLGFMAASFFLTLPLAWLSYQLVEAPALRLKGVSLRVPRLRARGRAATTETDPG